MTPSARIATAAGLLDEVGGGMAAERALLRWSRGARHAGSKDRAAVRDHVFDALRRWWSSAWAGGGDTGRARMLGLLRLDGIDPVPLFDGSRYGPEPLDAAERAEPGPMPDIVALDCPPWLETGLRAALGADFEAIMKALRHRAPTILRVNRRKIDRAGAAAALAREGIEAVPHPLAPTALTVTGNARRVAQGAVYVSGLVEIQDVASQALADLLPLADGDRVLDFCAGGGGKTLAMAGRADAVFHAHDTDPARMADIAPRASRAGVAVTCLDPAALDRSAPYDLVLVDAPCSGSGAWRRSPEEKIRLDAGRLAELGALQARILRAAARHVRRGGCLAYATCSLLDAENEAVSSKFLDDATEFRHRFSKRFTPLDGGDGFYLAVLGRD